MNEYPIPPKGKPVNVYKAMKLLLEFLQGGSINNYEHQLKLLEQGDTDDVMN